MKSFTGSGSVAKKVFVVASATMMAATCVAFAGNTWDGGGGDNNWGTGNNWSPDGSPSPGGGNDLFFAGSTRLSPFNNYSAGDDWRNITFNSGAGAFNLFGNVFDLFGKVENLSSNSQGMNMDASMQSSTANEFNPVNGNLVVGANNVYTNGNTLNVYGNNGNTLRFASNNVISGNGALVVRHNSNVELNSNHTYSGVTAVDAGTLQLNSTNARPGTNTVFIGNGGSGTLAGFSTLYANTNAALVMTVSGNTLTNAIQTNKADTGSGFGTGTRTVGGTFTTGSGTYSGTITLNGGVVFTAASGGTVNISGVVQNGSDGGNASRNVSKVGDGVVNLSSSNTYTGSTTVSQGTFSLATTGSITATSSVSVASGATLNVNGTLTSSGSTSVSGSLTGTGTVSSNTTINSGGTLAPGNSGAGKLTVSKANATLASGSTSTFQITGTTRGTQHDALDVNQVTGTGGALSYNGSLSIPMTGTYTAGTSFDLFDFTSQSGNFSSIAVSGSYTGSLVNNGGGIWSSTISGMIFTFTNSNGVLSLSAQAVPEPLTAAGVILLAGRLLGRRSRTSL